MRSDMFKVIVERPRRGKQAEADARKLRDDLDGPMFLGVRRGYGRPWLNENLSPLRRFLSKQVGRPWAKVHSELCETVDRRNTVQQHVLQHVEDFVAIRTWRDGDEILFAGTGWRSSPQRLAESRQDLYVDPASGILRQNSARRSFLHPWERKRLAAQAEIEKRRRILTPTEQLHCIDGLWFRVTLGTLPECTKVEARPRAGARRADQRWDAVRNAYVSRRDWAANCQLFDDPSVYASSRQQLGKKELRRYGL